MLQTCVRCGTHLTSEIIRQGPPVMAVAGPAILKAGLWSAPQTDWKRAVSDAEKIVGYPTSFMSLRCLLSDEISNVAMHMRKLVGTKHPLLKTARGFIYDGKHSLQARGLIVLLMSKAAGPGPETLHKEMDTMVSGIYPRQRTLAEITEMIHTAVLIHKGIVNLEDMLPSHGNRSDMEFGNKMAVLSGDFLLANASTGLASLHDTYVVELMSTAIGDLMKTAFTKLRGSVGGANLELWKEQTFKASGSLLAKSCQSAMILANHNDIIQKDAFNFGEHVAYAYQLHEELQPFLDTFGEGKEKLCVTSAPVIIYSQTSGKTPQAVMELKKQQLYQAVLESSAVMKTQELCEEYGQKAMEALHAFKPSESRTALQNIVHAVTKS